VATDSYAFVELGIEAQIVSADLEVMVAGAQNLANGCRG
jgi:hypothetical protein